MKSDGKEFNHTELFEDFPELTEASVVFEKEVFAHFGLLFSAYGNLEAALQLCYVFSNLKKELSEKIISNQDEWESRYDFHERKAFGATFGTLLKLVGELSELAPHQDELVRLKRIRDYFAHHFFREENGKLHTGEAMLFLMAKMNHLRKEVRAMHEICDEVQMNMFLAIYPNSEGRFHQELQKLKYEAELNPTLTVGWDEQ